MATSAPTIPATIFADVRQVAPAVPVPASPPRAPAADTTTMTKLPLWRTNVRPGCPTANSSSRWGVMCSLLPGLGCRCHFYRRRNFRIGRDYYRDEEAYAVVVPTIPIAPLQALHLWCKWTSIRVRLICTTFVIQRKVLNCCTRPSSMRFPSPPIATVGLAEKNRSQGLPRFSQSFSERPRPRTQMAGQRCLSCHTITGWQVIRRPMKRWTTQTPSPAPILLVQQL